MVLSQQQRNQRAPKNSVRDDVQSKLTLVNFQLSSHFLIFLKPII